jgi:hypothetical protein
VGGVEGKELQGSGALVTVVLESISVPIQNLYGFKEDMVGPPSLPVASGFF